MAERGYAGGVIVQNRAILLGLRSPQRTLCPAVWDIFGGHITAVEHPEQALFRELEEELGIVPVRCWLAADQLVSIDGIAHLRLAHPSYPQLFTRIIRQRVL